ncbi:hypothetical protein KUTeg_005261 [Tegillarca granosa]|uniref:Uncharacterized protein n=1 Tax=Tegillarca granosa TaxID=220873 RepID=A0ABQ9FL62_TEGGR|nr:hypothetical protein KUTeg_005261 [Tegillarca granosa]
MLLVDYWEMCFFTYFLKLGNTLKKLPDECEDEEEDNDDTELLYKQKSETKAETTDTAQEDSVRLRKTKNKKDVKNGKIFENGYKDKVLNNKDKKQNTVEKNKNGGQQSSIRISGYLNLMANVIDNFTHGLAVAGSFLVSNKVGFVTTLAILLHEVPHELLTATGGMVIEQHGFCHLHPGIHKTDIFSLSGYSSYGHGDINSLMKRSGHQ